MVSAQAIEGSDKLVKLMIGFGDHQRQIVAGIAQSFPDVSVLVGKQMPVVVNLEPKMLKGVESQGMILAASNEGQPVLLKPEKEVPPGSLVK